MRNLKIRDKKLIALTIETAGTEKCTINVVAIIGANLKAAPDRKGLFMKYKKHIKLMEGHHSIATQQSKHGKVGGLCFHTNSCLW